MDSKRLGAVPEETNAWLSALLDPWDDADLETPDPVTATRLLHRVDLWRYDQLREQGLGLPSLSRNEPSDRPEWRYMAALITRLEGGLEQSASQWLSIVEDGTAPLGVRLSAGVRAAGAFRQLLLTRAANEASRLSRAPSPRSARAVTSTRKRWYGYSARPFTGTGTRWRSMPRSCTGCASC